MANTTKTYTINPDLEAALLAAAAIGKPVRVKSTKTIRVRVDEQDDPWANYDAEAAREAVKNTAGILKDVDAEAWIARIKEEREQDTPGRPADR